MAAGRGQVAGRLGGDAVGVSGEQQLQRVFFAFYLVAGLGWVGLGWLGGWVGWTKEARMVQGNTNTTESCQWRMSMNR